MGDKFVEDFKELDEDIIKLILLELSNGKDLITCLTLARKVRISWFAAGGTSDPIIRLYHAWHEAYYNLKAQSEQNTGMTNDKLDDLCKVCYEYGDQIRSLTATSLEGLACQIQLAWIEDGPTFEEGSPHYSECMAEPANILLKSLADGASKLIPIRNQTKFDI